MQDSKRNTDVQNSLLDSVGEGEGGTIWKNGTETRIIGSSFIHLIRTDSNEVDETGAYYTE